MATIHKLTWCVGVLVLCVLSSPPAPSQPKDKDKKVAPKVIMALPLGVAPGQTTKVTVRGLQLDKSSAIKFASDKVQAKIIGKGKAEVPDKNPEQVGDSQFVIEVTLPKDFAEAQATFEIETAEGKTKPHALLIETKLPVVPQKEPNDGFAAAQKVQVPQVIDGAIDRAQDVDVYAFTGKAGDKVLIEVLAQRHGSVLDAMLTLYDASGQQVAFTDNLSDSSDAVMNVTLTKTGTFYLSLIDAHDKGGVTYPYRLVIKSVP